jgi:hypothetical protein
VGRLVSHHLVTVTNKIYSFTTTAIQMFPLASTFLADKWLSRPSSAKTFRYKKQLRNCRPYVEIGWTLSRNNYVLLSFKHPCKWHCLLIRSSDTSRRSIDSCKHKPMPRCQDKWKQWIGGNARGRRRAFYPFQILFWCGPGGTEKHHKTVGLGTGCVIIFHPGSSGRCE